MREPHHNFVACQLVNKDVPQRIAIVPVGLQQLWTDGRRDQSVVLTIHDCTSFDWGVKKQLENETPQLLTDKA